MRFPSSDVLRAQIDWQPLFEDHGIPLALMGLFVVFAALTLLRVFIGSLPRLLAVLDRFHPEQRDAALSTTAAEPASDELPAELLAVIAAAVAATVIEPHRIVSLRVLTAQELSWSLEGRLQQHASHRPKP